MTTKSVMQLKDCTKSSLYSTALSKFYLDPENYGNVKVIVTEQDNEIIKIEEVSSSSTQSNFRKSSIDWFKTDYTPSGFEPQKSTLINCNVLTKSTARQSIFKLENTTHSRCMTYQNSTALQAPLENPSLATTKINNNFTHTNNIKLDFDGDDRKTDDEIKLDKLLIQLKKLSMDDVIIQLVLFINKERNIDRELYKSFAVNLYVNDLISSKWYMSIKKFINGELDKELTEVLEPHYTSDNLKELIKKRKLTMLTKDDYDLRIVMFIFLASK